MSDYLVWTDDDDDERAIDTRPPWWGQARPREMTWAEADELDEILDIE